MYHSNSCMKYSCIFSSDHNTLFRVIKQNPHKITTLTQHLKNRRSIWNIKNPFLDVDHGYLKFIMSQFLPMQVTLTLFRMGFFGAAHEWGGAFCPPPPSKICHTYPTIMKLGTDIPYLRKIQKMYKSRDTFLEFC